MQVDETVANRRLTAADSIVLLVFLAAEGATILFMRPLFTWHVLIGMLLVPPVALKLASTGWRFARYYLGDPQYRRAGPPTLLMRLTAPLVVLSTLAVFGTGVAMAVVGPSSGGLIGIHKATFIVWLIVTAVHVLGHIWQVPALVRRVRKPQTLLVLGALIVGIAVAGASIPLVHPWTSWLQERRSRSDG
ncbi:MAG: hypothetical protein ACYDA3_03665 [Gaiellaceae bacterium]